MLRYEKLSLTSIGDLQHELSRLTDGTTDFVLPAKLGKLFDDIQCQTDLSLERPANRDIYWWMLNGECPEPNNTACAEVHPWPQEPSIDRYPGTF